MQEGRSIQDNYHWQWLGICETFSAERWQAESAFHPSAFLLEKEDKRVSQSDAWRIHSQGIEYLRVFC